MSLSDFRPAHSQGYLFPLRAVSRPHCRISQVPRLIFPHALSPPTPESPSAALTRSFTDGYWLHRCLPTGHSQLLLITRPSYRVRFCYGSRVRLTRLRTPRLLLAALARLPVARAIDRV